MADETYLQQAAEKPVDFGVGPKGEASMWKAEIAACDKDMEKWHTQGQKVVDRYRDERKDSSFVAVGTTRRYNILWSNIRTIKPAIFGRKPNPVVKRRYNDPDQVARVASLILERTVQFQIDSNRTFVDSLKSALEDRLLPGMGTVWVRYSEPSRPEQPAEGNPAATEAITTAVPSKNVGCMAVVDYVYWRDFGFVPARTWEEVPAVWRSVYMDRAALEKRFGKEKGAEIPLDYVPARFLKDGKESEEPKNAVFKQARVYEIWDKRTGKVSWLSMGMDELLDQKDDPMQFPGFFPCPKPLFATNTTGNLIPVPDYVEYQDQALELDEITERLYYLTKALKVVGVYDQENTAIQRVLSEGVENEMIPVDSWAAFAEKGGIKGVVDFVPIEQIITVVKELTAIRQQLIQDIFQITGLSDIVRGASNPNETAAAQRIKAQYASVRLEDMKSEMAHFVTEVLQHIAHIACDLFTPQELIDQSSIMQSEDGKAALKEAQDAMMASMQASAGQAPGIPGQAPVNSPPNSQPTPNGQPSVSPAGPMGAPPPQAQPMSSPPPGMGAPPPGMGMQPPGMGMPPPPPPDHASIVQQAIQLLRDQRSMFRIEVAADSLIEPDLDAERQRRNEFLTAVTQFLQEAVPAAQQTPEMAPLLNALLLWGVRGFRVGRDIEGMIESSLAKMGAAGPKPPPPDPKIEALKVKAGIDQQKANDDRAAAQAEFAMEQQRLQQEMEMEREKLQAFREKAQAEVQAMLQKAQAEVDAILMKAQVTAGIQRDKAVQDAQNTALQTEASVASDAARMQHDMQQSDQVHAQQIEHGAQAHEQSLEQTKAAAKVKAETTPKPPKEGK